MSYLSIACALVIGNVLIALGERSWPNAALAGFTALVTWWEYRRDEAARQDAMRDQARRRAGAAKRGFP